MQKRWASAFTIVELIIIIVVIAIIAAVITVGYGQIRRSALETSALSDLNTLANIMETNYFREGNYPTQLPEQAKASHAATTLTLVRSGATPYYTNLSTVQNGVLLSQICTDLINEGVGKGVDQGGTTRDYITGCGNWNDDSMQITGWSTRVWNTPVAREQLTNYADTYTVSDTFHKQAQETAVKTFYREMVRRLEAQGGSFPVSSFWDYWATPTNGGVMMQPLPTGVRLQAYYCAEARVTHSAVNKTWHVTQESKIKEGACS